MSVLQNGLSWGIKTVILKI